MTLFALPACGWASASIASIGTLSGGTNTATVTGMAPGDGVVFGYSSSANGTEAFRWSSLSGMEGLGDLPGGGFASFAAGSDLFGTRIVGRGNAGVQRGFQRQAFMSQVPGIAGGTSTSDRANAMSYDGTVIAGWSNSLAYGQRATKWVGGGLGVILQDLAGGSNFSEALGMNTTGQTLVGWSYSDLGKEAVAWEGELLVHLGDLAGGPTDAYANACSNNRTVVGRGWDGNGATAFRWTPHEGMQLLGNSMIGQPAFNSEAYDINPEGSVIVGRGNMPDGSGAFIWTPVLGMRSLKSVLAEQGADVTGFQLIDARAVSHEGLRIAGNCIANGVITGFIAQLNPHISRVYGYVSLGDIVGPPTGQVVNVEFWQSGVLKGEVAASLDQDGFYFVPNGLSGTVQICISGAPFLRKVGPTVNLVPNGDPMLASFTLTNGDSDGSGEVDAADIDLVIAGFGVVTGDASYSTAIDVDRSGEVDAADIDVVIENFGATDE